MVATQSTCNYLFTLATTSSSTTTENSSSFLPKTKNPGHDGGGGGFWGFHGTVLTAAWTVVNFIGYVAARYFKHYPVWYWVHIICCGLTSLVSISVMTASIILSRII